MSMNKLSPAKGSTHSAKRRGRGSSSGLGGSAGRGEKGYLARSGSVRKRGFEGGQMPIYRRLPKFGFKNIWAETVQIVNVGELSKLTGSIVDPATLKKAGLIRYEKMPVKILGNGDAPRALEIQGCKLSASAETKITAAGGKVVTA
jgi:large subunit ribosomal protein L15